MPIGWSRYVLADICFHERDRAWEMELANQSMIAEFILLGLSDRPMLKKTFFVLILSMYLVILLGNGVLILVTILDAHLHTPMYFFLGEPLLPGHLLHHFLHPPGSGWFPHCQENNLFLRLCSTDVSLLCHGSHGVCAPGHDGV